MESRGDLVRNRSKQKGARRSKSVRFSPLDHFRRVQLSTLLFFPVKNDRISSWKYLFFYRCTDEISFAPLKSQGVDSRLKYIRENTVEAAPPPCSPKSIYVLAYLVRRTSTSTLCMILTCQFQLEIKPLSDSVLADMRSNVASYGAGDNVDSLVTAA